MNDRYRFAIQAFNDAGHMVEASRRRSDGALVFEWLPDGAEIVSVTPLPWAGEDPGSAFRLLFVYVMGEDVPAPVAAVDPPSMHLRISDPLDREMVYLDQPLWADAGFCAGSYVTAGVIRGTPVVCRIDNR